MGSFRVMLHQALVYNARRYNRAGGFPEADERLRFLGFVRSPWGSTSSKIIQVLRFSSCHQESAVASSSTVSALVDEISGLTLLEVCDLTEVLRNKLGIKEMPMMMVMMPGAGFAVRGAAKGASPSMEEQKAVEKTAFDLKLEKYDAAAKIKIIKEVRTFTALGLKEAKDLVEQAPTLLKKSVSKEEGEKIIANMKELGAVVTMD